MKITPVENKLFGATVTDVSFSDLGDADFKTLKAAFLEYGLLVFSGIFSF